MYQGALSSRTVLGEYRRIVPHERAVVASSATTRGAPRLKKVVKYEGRSLLLRACKSGLRNSIKNSYWSHANQREHVDEMTGTRCTIAGKPVDAMISFVLVMYSGD